MEHFSASKARGVARTDWNCNLRPSLIINWFWKPKINGGFSTFASVFDPGTGIIRPAVVKFRQAFLRDSSNNVGRFFRIAKKKIDIPQFCSKSVSDATYPKNMSFFSDETAAYIRNWFCDILLKIRTHTLKKRPMPLDASRKKASRYLRTAGPILPVAG